MFIKINRRYIIPTILLSILYVLLCCFFSDNTYIIPNVLMGFLICLGVLLVYDDGQSVFSIKNLFFLLFYVIGIYGRYLYTLIVPDRFMNFTSYATRNVTAGGHINSILVIIVFTIAFIIGNAKTKSERPLVRVPEKPPINAWIDIVYILFTVVYLLYGLSHIRLATVQDYGTYDNLFNNIAYFNRLIAYMYLILFFDEKKKKYVFMYAIFVVPYIALSLLSLYKGTILTEILIFMVIVAYKRKIRLRHFAILGIAFIIVFPMISMLRSNGIVSGTYNISFEGIGNYLKDNNPIEYILYRFQYYDETYFVVNTSAAEMSAFRETIIDPITSFFTSIIPRAIWHNKPVGNLSYSITHTLCNIPTSFTTNVTIGEIGGSYIYWGYPSVIFFALIHGYLMRKVDNFLYDKESYPAFSAYVVFGYAMINFTEGLVVGKIVIVISLIIVYMLLRILQDFNSKKGGR